MKEISATFTFEKGSVCRHGQLARSCNICELEMENAELRAKLAAAEAKLAAQDALLAQSHDALRLTREEEQHRSDCTIGEDCIRCSELHAAVVEGRCRILNDNDALTEASQRVEERIEQERREERERLLPYVRHLKTCDVEEGPILAGLPCSCGLADRIREGDKT